MKPYYFDEDSLAALAEKNRESFRNASPFPHVVIDDFLPAWVLDGVLSEFPTRDGVEWTRFNRATSKKLAFDQETRLGDFTRQLLVQFNARTFLGFLETLTGIDGLIPDPYFSGGGLHEIEPGGFLKIHADFNRLEKLRLDRRLNVLVYLNRDWDSSYGGALELWDRTMDHAEERVLPLFNRCVVFATADDSYHGHPEPLSCPQDRRRRSLALYYYTNGRPEEEGLADHGTLYQERPGERLPRGQQVAERLAPPVLVDAVRAVARRFR